MELRREKVVVDTDRQRVTGWLTLPAEGHNSRVSDYLGRREAEFLILQDAQVEPSDGGEPWTVPVLMVARAHVRLVQLSEG